MARRRNRGRKHYVAPYTDGSPVAEEEYILLDKWFQTIGHDVNEQTDDSDYYHMDAPTTQTVNRTRSYPFEGHYDEENEQHMFIAGLEDALGEDQLVMFKVVSSSGKKQREGVAKLHDVIIGGGAPSDWEPISFTITYESVPPAEDVPLGG